MANIGDSAARPDVPEQVLYGEGQQADIAAALGMLADRGETKVVLVGRCSGAFAAFHATARNITVVGAVMINPLRLIWDPEEDVEVAIRIGPRSMADYRQRVMSGKVFKRLLDGDIDVGGAVKGVGIQLARRVVRRLAPLAGTMSKTMRLRRQCRTMMEGMERRGTVLRFVCSERDSSLEQMAFYFGGEHRGLRRFAGASLITVPDADHNITPQPAHDRVVEVIRQTALRFRVELKQDRLNTGRPSRPRAISIRSKFEPGPDGPAHQSLSVSKKSFILAKKPVDSGLFSFDDSFWNSSSNSRWRFVSFCGVSTAIWT